MAPDTAAPAPPRRTVADVADRPAPRLPAATRGLRPLSVPQLLDGACGVLKRRARAVVPTVLVLTLPVQVVATMLRRAWLADGGSVAAGWLELATAVTLTEVVLSYLLLALDSLVLLLAGAAVAHIVAADRMGRELPAGQALGRTVRRLPAYLVAWFLRTGAIVLAGCTFAGPIAFVTLWVLTAPVMAIEGLGPIAGLGRAWRLAAKRFWPLLGLVCLTALVSGIVGLSLSALPLLATLIEPLARFAWLIEGVADQLTMLVTVPIVVGATALAYLDVRIRVEGLDLELDRTAAFPDAP